MTLVPRVFEMFQEGLLRNVAKEPSRKQQIFNWALSVGERRTGRIQDRQTVPFLLAFKWWLADRLVFSKIRGRLGLDRLKLFLTGSAPLPKATAEFFSALGVTILEGYGLTETSPLVAVNRPGRIKFGTVGPPVKDVEVKIATDGEILVRGPNVMKGYYNMPDETAEVIDADGWFRTGDIGEFDEDGFLKITDRKKDLLVLANGKKVAPQPIENLLKESPYISQVILFGDKQSIVTALVVPLFERVKGWVKERGINASSIKDKELAQLAAVKHLIQEEIERLSGHLANFEKIHRFSLIDHELTLEGGEMTPTLKVKRRVVMEKYRDLIEAMYR
jgi:long-chain acyl-CoA synthetase